MGSGRETRRGRGELTLRSGNGEFEFRDLWKQLNGAKETNSVSVCC